MIEFGSSWTGAGPAFESAARWSSWPSPKEKVERTNKLNGRERKRLKDDSCEPTRHKGERKSEAAGQLS